MVLYLNDAFEGGTLDFIDPKDPQSLFVTQIETGMCVLFQHDICHQSAPIISGTKYIVRFDIVYKRISKGGDPVGARGECLWL